MPLSFADLVYGHLIKLYIPAGTERERERKIIEDIEAVGGRRLPADSLFGYSKTSRLKSELDQSGDFLRSSVVGKQDLESGSGRLQGCFATMLA